MLANAIDHVLSEQLRKRFGIDAALISVAMAASIMGALILVAVMVAADLTVAAQKPLIKLAASKQEPDLPLRQNQYWHMFLSQCARTS